MRSSSAKASEDRRATQARAGEWAARTDTPKRSVFGNYSRSSRREEAPSENPQSATHNPQSAIRNPQSLQSAIDQGVARAFIHSFLAGVFADPTLETWSWLSAGTTKDSLLSAAGVLSAAAHASATALLASLEAGTFDVFHSGYLSAFGHAARGSCPLNEIEYGDIKADPLFQPHRLADLAAFYRAFGLEVAETAGERHDHISLELEFMCVLAAKEAYALEHQLDLEQLAACRQAQKKFLREHLGRWTPAFTRRLAAATNTQTLQLLAAFTRIFVESECARFGVNPGSEELLLRPVDDAADRMCDSCGISKLPPGALASA